MNNRLQNDLTRCLTIILNFLIFAMIALIPLSTLLIWWSERPILFDLTTQGFNFALKLYQFPLGCVAGVIALTTVQLTKKALTQSSRQGDVATWAHIQSKFSEYVKKTQNLPLSALRSNPFTEGSPPSSEKLFTVVYMSPVTTLSRLFVTKEFGKELEPNPNPELINQLGRIHKDYKDLEERLIGGDEKWLHVLIDLANATRKLRLYLLVTTTGMDKWDYKPVLNSYQKSEDETEEKVKKYLPTYKSEKTTEIIGAIFQEMLCIAHAIHFSQRFKEEAEQLYDAAMSINRIWSRSDDRMKALLGEKISKLWHDQYML